jgi:hypothetical protein
MRKRNKWTRFLIVLRRFNLLCRKTQVNYAIRKRISHTIVPEGYDAEDFNGTYHANLKKQIGL